MKKRLLGKHGMQASVVAFGAWAIGGWKWGGSDAQASVAAVQASLDAGVDFIDTAAVYGFGLSEIGTCSNLMAESKVSRLHGRTA